MPTKTRTRATIVGSPGKPRLAACVAAGLSLLAAMIHLWVVPEYLDEWWAHGAFFLVCALLQGLFSVLVLRFPYSKFIALASIAGNSLIVLVYVISRTWGMPLGPDWRLFSPSVAHVEAPEVLGVAATVSELGVLFACVVLLGGAYREWSVNALLVLGALLVASRLAGLLP